MSLKAGHWSICQVLVFKCIFWGKKWSHHRCDRTSATWENLLKAFGIDTSADVRNEVTWVLHWPVKMDIKGKNLKFSVEGTYYSLSSSLSHFRGAHVRFVGFQWIMATELEPFDIKQQMLLLQMLKPKRQLVELFCLSEHWTSPNWKCSKANGPIWQTPEPRRPFEQTNRSPCHWRHDTSGFFGGARQAPA